MRQFLFLIILSLFPISLLAQTSANENASTAVKDAAAPYVLQQYFALKEELIRLKVQIETSEKNKGLDALIARHVELESKLMAQEQKLDQILKKQITQDSEFDFQKTRVKDLINNWDMHQELQASQLDFFSFTTAIFGAVMTAIAGFIAFFAIKLGRQAKEEVIKEAKEYALEHINEWLKQEVSTAQKGFKETLETQLKEAMEEANQQLEKCVELATDKLKNIEKVHDETLENSEKLAKILAKYNTQITPLTSEQREELKAIPTTEGSPEDLLKQAFEHSTNLEYDKALGKYDLVTKHSKTGDSQMAMAIFRKGYILGEMKKYKEAIEQYDLYESLFEHNTKIDIQELYALGLANKAWNAIRSEQYEQAIKVCESVIEKFSSNKSDYFIGRVMRAKSFKCLALGYQKKFTEAINAYEEYVELCKENDLPDIGVSVGSALANSAELSLLFEPTETTRLRITRSLQHNEERNLAYVVTIFVSFLIDDTDEIGVLKAIEKLDENTKFNWRFKELTSHLSELQGSKKDFADAFVDYFENHHNIELLRTKLNDIKSADDSE